MGVLLVEGADLCGATYLRGPGAGHDRWSCTDVTLGHRPTGEMQSPMGHEIDESVDHGLHLVRHDQLVKVPGAHGAPDERCRQQADEFRDMSWSVVTSVPREQDATDQMCNPVR